MKKIKAEIEQAMTGIESLSNGSLTSRFIFSDGFVGFQGHFPQKKILPGVCQIQCALAAVQKAKQIKVTLKEVVLAKYFAPVAPNEEIVCSCSDIADAGEFTFKALITKGSTKVAELKLKVAAEKK